MARRYWAPNLTLHRMAAQRRRLGIREPGGAAIGELIVSAVAYEHESHTEFRLDCRSPHGALYVRGLAARAAPLASSSWDCSARSSSSLPYFTPHTESGPMVISLERVSPRATLAILAVVALWVGFIVYRAVQH